MHVYCTPLFLRWLSVPLYVLFMLNWSDSQCWARKQLPLRPYYVEYLLPSLVVCFRILLVIYLLLLPYLSCLCLLFYDISKVLKYIVYIITIFSKQNCRGHIASEVSGTWWLLYSGTCIVIGHLCVVHFVSKLNLGHCCWRKRERLPIHTYT